ncbi:MAG: DNA-processing protein DprA [Minisyncoccia bacterium]
MEYPIRKILPDDFPPLLAEMPGKPKQLYVRGTLPEPAHYKFLCVVGSRAAGAYGLRACQSLISGLSGIPVVVVSGLALGLDACAHEAALMARLPTVAVLPSGLDDTTIYPASNRLLAARILKMDGALVSEFEPGMRATNWSFPSRNRIMAGFSHATLIVEAGEQSGTLITARLALDFNREVLCAPPPIDSQKGAGNNRLIREGATLVRDAADILYALDIISDPGLAGARQELPPDLSGDERALCLALVEPLTRDELIEATEISAQAAGIALSTLLIRGLIVERLGKIERT